MVCGKFVFLLFLGGGGGGGEMVVSFEVFLPVPLLIHGSYFSSEARTR